VLLTNPSLLPPRGIERALLDASRRGAPVRLLLAARAAGSMGVDIQR